MNNEPKEYFIHYIFKYYFLIFKGSEVTVFFFYLCITVAKVFQLFNFGIFYFYVHMANYLSISKWCFAIVWFDVKAIWVSI